VDFGTSTLSIPANQQIAKFLDQDPFNVLVGRNSFQGTFSFTSNVEVSVVALRGFLNERAPSEFLITTLPVTNPAAVPGTGTVFLPHFADGGGWTTQIVLVNPTEGPITGSIQFWSQGGATPAAPLTVTANNQTASTFNYTIPRQSSFKLVTAGTAAGTAAGSVRVTPATGSSPSSLVVFSFNLAVPISQLANTVTRATLGIAMASVMLSFLMIITRRKAIPQVVGFLAMENGLFFAATSATYGMPMVVELGVALDVLVGMLILGVFFFQIREQFDSLDLKHMEKLKEGE